MDKIIQEGTEDKSAAFQQTADFLFKKGFKVINIDITRPWGFYFYVDTDQIGKFIDEFYKGTEFEDIDTSLPMQPKILGIEPGKRLSWQYHHRRSEIWRCIDGEFSVITSDNDTEKDTAQIKTSDVISLSQGTRHRGIGSDQWSLFAEIWQHTDATKPSDEDDIVRVADDFGRR